MQHSILSMEAPNGYINIYTNTESIKDDIINYFSPNIKFVQNECENSLFNIHLLLDENLDVGTKLNGTEKEFRLFGSRAEKESKFLTKGLKRRNGCLKEFFVPYDDPDTEIRFCGKEIMISGNKTPRVLREARRVIRDQILRKLNEKQGRINLHGSAMSCCGKGVLVMGASGSGKTTTVLHSLANRKADFMSGDRVDISINNGGGISIYGSLEPIHLDKRSLLRYEQLKDVAEFQFSSRRVKIDDGKRLIERKTLVDAFKCKYISESPLALVMLPKINQYQKQLKIEKVDYKYFSSVFKKNVFSLEDPYRPNWSDCFRYSKKSCEDTVYRIIKMIDVLQIPCIAVSGTFDDYINFLDTTAIGDIIKEYT